MPIPPLRSLRPEVPKELEEVVFRCLERDPRHRVSTAVELMEALFPFASEAIGSLRVDSLRRTIAAPAGAAAPRAPATDLTFGQSTRARGSRLPVVIPSVIAISLAAVLGWQFLASSPPDAGPRAPAPASAPEAVLDEAHETDGAPGEEDADEEPEAEAAPQPMTSASASASATASVAPPAPPPPRWRGLGLDDRR